MLKGKEKDLGKYLLIFLGLCLTWLLHGAVPFVAMPTLGQAVWTTGFSTSFANTSLFAIHAGNIGIPEPAAIAFGLAGAYPASIFIHLGLHPADAYAAMAMFWFGIAFLGAYRIARYFGLHVLPAVLASIAWITLPIISGHSGYSMLSMGIALLPAYFYAMIHLMDAGSSTLWAKSKKGVVYLLACLVAVFMDGYTFMMFAVGASLIIFFCFFFYKQKNKKTFIATFVFPIHIIGLFISYYAYTSYIGTSSFQASPLANFRGWGADLTFFITPPHGVIWLWDSLGMSVGRTRGQYFGDASTWNTTFALPIVLLSVVSVWYFRAKKTMMFYGFLLVALFSLYMSLGPSLKINSTKSEDIKASMGRMPAEAAVLPTGSAILSKYVPGFKSMRASYRWFALSLFSLWLLLVFSLARRNRSNNIAVNLILIALILSYFPDLREKWGGYTSHREGFMAIDRDLLNPLKKHIKPTDTVVSLPYRNDFLMNYLASAINAKSYNIGGDKNLRQAQKHWPARMRQFKMGQVDAGFSKRIVELLANKDATVVLLPYFDMLWAAHRWPRKKQFKTEMEKVIATLSNYKNIEVHEDSYFSLVMLKK